MGGGRGGNSSKLSKLSNGGDGGGAGISRSKCALTHKVNKLTKLAKCKCTIMIIRVFEGDVGNSVPRATSNKTVNLFLFYLFFKYMEAHTDHQTIKIITI